MKLYKIQAARLLREKLDIPARKLSRDLKKKAIVKKLKEFNIEIEIR